ncbi:MAG TPA: DUF6084 family protein [Pirellulales bacterium]|jgi:hypothetical protein|nr:DUF6084 family protein [Pirellulales bacterium]
MPELNFQVEAVEADRHSISPLLIFKLRITNADPEEQIQSIALRCQLQIESTRRRYSPEEQAHLKDLFGEPDRWNQTLRGMLWTHASAQVPPFLGSVVADLPVPCTFDFNVAATKYFHGLADGEVPLILLFSGSVFYRDGGGELQVCQIPWDKETRHRLPVAVWQRMMDIHYPNSAWLSLRTDAYDRLCRFKVQHGIPTWEQAIERLLDAAGDELDPLAAERAPL